jgi:hypothetical protein
LRISNQSIAIPARGWYGMVKGTGGGTTPSQSDAGMGVVEESAVSLILVVTGVKGHESEEYLSSGLPCMVCHH